MVHICYALTLSSSMIAYSKNIQDEKVFEAMVQSMVSLNNLYFHIFGEIKLTWSYKCFFSRFLHSFRNKGIRALRGYFGPLWSQNLKVAFHQFLVIGLLGE